MENKWYAVMLDRDDNDWGTGSFDRDEAERMVVNMAEVGNRDGYLAVIENDVCVDEILPEDFDRLNYYAWYVKTADTWADLDDMLSFLALNAGMESEWANADGDNVEDVIRKIGDKLGYDLV